VGRDNTVSARFLFTSATGTHQDRNRVCTRILAVAVAKANERLAITT
jgi:hypothetical protein